jgi:hypothetical protein
LKRYGRQKDGETHQQVETGAGAAFNNRHHLPRGFSLSGKYLSCFLCASFIDGWKKSFDQPAKQADRVLAPGDGEAEPGEPTQSMSQPTKWATDEICQNDSSSSFQNTASNICRQLRRLSEIGVHHPRLGFAIAWG